MSRRECSPNDRKVSDSAVAEPTRTSTVRRQMTRPSPPPHRLYCIPMGGMDGRSPGHAGGGMARSDGGNDARSKATRRRPRRVGRLRHCLPPCAPALMRRFYPVRATTRSTPLSGTPSGRSSAILIATIPASSPSRPTCAWQRSGTSATFRDTSGGTRVARWTGAHSIGMSMISTGSGTIREAISTIRYESVEEAESMREHAALLGRKMAILKHELTAEEIEALPLVLEKERKTAMYAHILGLDGLPRTEQKTRVKQFKDRIQKRLDRLTPDYD